MNMQEAFGKVLAEEYKLIPPSKLREEGRVLGQDWYDFRSSPSSVYKLPLDQRVRWKALIGNADPLDVLGGLAEGLHVFDGYAPEFASVRVIRQRIPRLLPDYRPYWSDFQRVLTTGAFVYASAVVDLSDASRTPSSYQRLKSLMDDYTAGAAEIRVNDVIQVTADWLRPNK